MNRRSIDAIDAVAKRFPNWTPLLHFAAVANDETLSVDIRLEAAKAAAPFMHPRPKHIELDADAAVELEGRLSGARAKAMVNESIDPLQGLGARLERLARRDDEDRRQAQN